MKISKIRSILYKLAKALGDVSAFKNKRVGRRVKNRVVGKWLSRLMRW